MHAEARAIRAASIRIQRGRAPDTVELVHAKIGIDDRLVAGDGPSCWQCSKEILDAGISAVWLFEYDADHPAAAVITGKGRWRRYTALEFHAATCRACEVY